MKAFLIDDEEALCETIFAIGEKWHEVNPKDDGKLAKMLKKWLDRGKNKSAIMLGSFTFDQFVRSYSIALKKLLIDLRQPVKKGNKEPLKTARKELEGLVRKKIKGTLKLKIDDLEFSIKPKPSINHLGNGFLEGVGSYSDIWPIISLITDCKAECNSRLAYHFLKFAYHPFAFKRETLVDINSKFEEKSFDSMISLYCRYLTGIAFLYTFFEPARRLEAEIKEEPRKLVITNVRVNQGFMHVANMITALKSLYEAGDATGVQAAFSPQSNLVLFTQKGVSRSSKKKKSESAHETISSSMHYAQPFFVPPDTTEGEQYSEDESASDDEAEVPDIYQVKSLFFAAEAFDERDDSPDSDGEYDEIGVSGIKVIKGQ